MRHIKCSKCGDTNPEHFSPNGIKHYICRHCKTLRHKLWQKNNPEKVAASNHRWRLNHLEYFQTEQFRKMMRNAMRKWASNHREEYNEYCRKWRQEHPDEWYILRMKYHYANMEAYRAQAKAKLEYPDRQLCEVDGCLEIGERHHPDYNKPYEIRWLCRQHHKDVHRGVLVLA